MRSRGSHAQRRSFVFVSHANADKKRIRHIVEALIKGGHKVWLDKPAEMGFRKHEIEAHFVDLRGGRGWKEQIDEALDTATCVLAVCTANFWKRYHSGGKFGRDISVVKEEVLRGSSKLVFCRGDETAFEGVSSEHQKQEFEDARQIKDDEGRSRDNLSRLVETVGRMMQEVEIRRAGEPSSARDPFEPYLIDRTEQERQARSVIDLVMSGGVHALFLQGPKNECIDRFRERLKVHTSRGVLDGATWSEALVTWPSVDPSEFTNAYADSLAQSLHVAPRRLFEQLGALRGALLAPMSVVALAEWDKVQPARVKAWLGFWRGRGVEAPAPACRALAGRRAARNASCQLEAVSWRTAQGGQRAPHPSRHGGRPKGGKKRRAGAPHAAGDPAPRGARGRRPLGAPRGWRSA